MIDKALWDTRDAAVNGSTGITWRKIMAEERQTLAVSRNRVRLGFMTLGERPKRDFALVMRMILGKISRETPGDFCLLDRRRKHFVRHSA